MWKLLIEIACLSFALICGFLFLLVQLRGLCAELGLSGEGFRATPASTKMLWLGIATALAGVVFWID